MNQNHDKRNFCSAMRALADKQIGLVALALVSLIVAASAAVDSRSRGYLAVATLELRPGHAAVMKQGAPAKEDGYDPAFVATQFEVIRSAETLEPVIQKLGLAKALSPDGHELIPKEALAALNSELVLSEKRGTTMITIGVRDNDPQLAATIANAIADVYRESRENHLKHTLEANLKQFKDQVDAQRKRAADEHEKVIHLLAELKAVDNDPTNRSAPGATGDGSLVVAVNAAQIKVDELKTKLEVINELKLDEPDTLARKLDAAAIKSDTVRTVLPLLQGVQAEEKRMLQLGMAENHPHLMETRAVEGQYKKMLEKEIEAIRRPRVDELQIAEESLKTLSESMIQATGKGAEWTRKIHDYVDAKTRYLEDQRISDSMNSQYKAELLKEKQDLPSVNIWEAAVPPAKR